MAARKKKLPTLPPADNLESDGDRLKIYSLQNVVLFKRDDRAHKKPQPVTLADILAPILKNQVNKPAENLGVIGDLWQQLVPEKLLSRSRLVGLHKSTLTVSMTHPTAKAELDALLRQSLLAQLQAASKGTVFRVRVTVDSRHIAEVF